MLLETGEVRQYYLDRAENDSLLQDIVAGTKTFTGCLEDCITGLKMAGDKNTFTEFFEDCISGLKKMAGASNTKAKMPLEEFGTLLYTLSGISDGELEAKQFNTTAEHMAKYNHNKSGSTYAFCWLAASLFFLLIPPVAAGELFYVAIGALGSLGSGPPFIKGWKARGNPEKAFAPVYEAVKHHDSLIGRSFILEHFRDARPRFEQTYPLLSKEERKQFDDYVYGLLGAGAMPGTDEIQLNEYLSGLLTSEGDEAGD